LKNTSDASRSGWGVLAFISQETSGDWTWHNLLNNTDLGTNEYGQLSCSSLDAGATGTIEVALATLKAAVASEGETNQLVLQTSNAVVLTKVTLSKK